MGPLERANAGALNEFFCIVPIPGYAHGERPQAWQHVGKHH
ncbi:hypothetical protein BSLA_03r1460 [Burkholderia stabilis]|nr:hypothetical protein BSLA_03r1460 [Burkholderia stabilis]